MPMYHEGVIRTSSMGLFTPKDQLRDMQQHYAAQSLLGNRRPDQESMLLQSVAASLLLGSPVTVVDDDLLGDDLLSDDLTF